MKIVLLIFTVVLSSIAVSAQEIPFERMDSISVCISQWQKQTGGKSYKDLKDRTFELSFPDENFNLLVYNRLATKAVYKKDGDKEALMLTENIDFSKATSITTEDDNNGVTYIKAQFPDGHLKTQVIENGKAINTIDENFLEFFCRQGAVDSGKNLIMDRMFFTLCELGMQLKAEKGLMTGNEIKAELSDWKELSSEAFLAKYPKSLLAIQASRNFERHKLAAEALQKNQDYVNQFAATYKFKRGLSPSQFIDQNPASAFLFRKKGFLDGYSTTYNNISGLGNPYPEGPLVVVVGHSSNTVIVYDHVVFSSKDPKEWAAIDSFYADIWSHLDKKYIKEVGNRWEIDVPDANAKMTISVVAFNKRRACFITFK